MKDCYYVRITQNTTESSSADTSFVMHAKTRNDSRRPIMFAELHNSPGSPRALAAIRRNVEMAFAVTAESMTRVSVPSVPFDFPRCSVPWPYYGQGDRLLMASNQNITDETTKKQRQKKERASSRRAPPEKTPSVLKLTPEWGAEEYFRIDIVDDRLHDVLGKSDSDRIKHFTSKDLWEIDTDLLWKCPKGQIRNRNWRRKLLFDLDIENDSTSSIIIKTTGTREEWNSVDASSDDVPSPSDNGRVESNPSSSGIPTSEPLKIVLIKAEPSKAEHSGSESEKYTRKRDRWKGFHREKPKDLEKAGVVEGKGDTKRESVVSVRLEIKKNPAAILILGVGARECSEKFAELIGVASPRVIATLAEFVRPPLLKLAHLPVLMQCAARAMTEGDRERRIGNYNPVELTIHIVDVLAFALSHVSHNDVREQQLEKLIVDTVYYGYRHEADKEQQRNDCDTGCRIGFFVASLQLCVLQTEEKREKRQKVIDTIIDVACGLLGGTPVAGFAFGAAAPLLKILAERYMLQDGQQKTMAAIRLFYRSNIEHQIFRDNRLEIKVGVPAYQDGKRITKNEIKEVKIQYDDFEKWYKKILEWTGMNMY